MCSRIENCNDGQLDALARVNHVYWVSLVLESLCVWLIIAVRTCLVLLTRVA
jgi:hypothetical protein